MRSEQEITDVLYRLRVLRGWDDGATEKVLAWVLDEPGAQSPEDYPVNEYGKCFCEVCVEMIP